MVAQKRHFCRQDRRSQRPPAASKLKRIFFGLSDKRPSIDVRIHLASPLTIHLIAGTFSDASKTIFNPDGDKSSSQKIARVHPQRPINFPSACEISRNYPARNLRANTMYARALIIIYGASKIPKVQVLAMGRHGVAAPGVRQVVSRGRVVLGHELTVTYWTLHTRICVHVPNTGYWLDNSSQSVATLTCNEIRASSTSGPSWALRSRGWSRRFVVMRGSALLVWWH